MADSVNVVLGPDGLLPVACPAGEAVAAVRGAGHMVGSEVPGVRCRIAHETINLIEDPRSIALFCCSRDGTADGEAGHRRCPLMEHDKSLIAAGRRSMGDKAVMLAENEATLREDVTGSRHGDLSWIDHLDESARQAVLEMQASQDGFIRAEGGKA
jgi:hypothetical protein